MQKTNDFYMPAEWEEHERTLIEWPVRASMVWPENYDEVCGGYAGVVKAILEFEPVTVIVNEDTRDLAASLCGAAAELLTIPHNDAWCRDNGPTFVRSMEGVLSGISWKFNAWGEKYKPFDLDDAVAGRVLRHYMVPVQDAPIILEGGSIHVDGEGTMLTTEQCLLNPNRNKLLTKEEIERELERYLNVTRVLWLENGLFGDETDGHIDNIACFASPGKVLFQSCYDEEDPNCEITRVNLERLRNSRDAKGRALEIIEIQQPPIRYYKEERLTLSYLNFYFVNNGIILPVFGGAAAETDKKAEAVLQQVFPDKRIKAVDGMPLIREGGNVHCITQQMPAGLRPGRQG